MENTLSYENYEACMVLAAVGDAMGYKNGNWEFQKSGINIHKEMQEITKGTGPLSLKIDLSWRYSDDTVMHIATAKALSKSTPEFSITEIGQKIAIEYKKCWKRMSGRAPGKTTCKSVSILSQNGENWNKIPYNERAAGCGAAMRSACIGLAFQSIDRVIAVAIESGRITHHNPIAYLGSAVSSCFTYFALRKIDPAVWAALLFEEVFPKAKDYINTSGRQVERNLGNSWKFFENAWEKYVQLRKLSNTSKEIIAPTFPNSYSIIEREHFYKQVSFKGWGGASGHDSVIIAYDAILGCKGDWEEFCLRGILHGGDNDSTGSIGAAWFGALWGFKGVPDNHRRYVQDIEVLKILSTNLFNLKKM